MHAYTCTCRRVLRGAVCGVHAYLTAITACCAHTCRNLATVGCLERTGAKAAAIRGTAGTRGTVTANSA